MSQKIGLVDVDGHGFPNLALMKISAYHKTNGDSVEFADHLTRYDKVYVSKVFGDEYSAMNDITFNADETIYGGTGFEITVENDKEVYHKDKAVFLPCEIEHQCPDYSLYPHLTENKSFGHLSRGCPNNCSFCIVSQKEGMNSVKVSDLSEWWEGQKEIVLLDPNILACRDRKELLQQLIDSGAKVDFTQGLDARFITVEIANMLKQINTKMWHFAFDFMKNEKRILDGLKIFVDVVEPNRRNGIVYMLTNYDTCFADDYYRVKKIKEVGLDPDVRVYRKAALPQRHIAKDLQRWCNNRFIFRSGTDFWEYAPRKDGKTMKETYPTEYNDCKERGLI